MLIDYKAYKVNNNWGIECYINENPCTGVKSYRVDVIMLGVPWKEIMESYTKYNKDDANKVFLDMVKKYKMFNGGITC